MQDTACHEWREVVDRIDGAIRDGATELDPTDGFTGDERARIVTLPSSIARLTTVRRLSMVASFLTRVPPEIGAMTSLADLNLYMSYRLHFLPYEITRCPSLVDSCISTRALFGSFSNRGHFPDLLHADNSAALAVLRPSTCSVCNTALPATGAVDRWITLRIGTDVVPLLVSACSLECIATLPTPPAHYVSHPHTGGSAVMQPTDWPFQNARNESSALS
ncbi:MAG: hypothetical protein U0P30_04590 [Vicinamibacterales bacterium]